MARINTKILSFGDVQKSLQEIEKELNLLSESVNSPAETNIEDSQGKTGDVKIIKNPDKTYTFKVRSAEGWQSPIFDHDSMTNFVANEHIDWTTDQGSTNIHTGNYVAGGTSEFTLTADSGSDQTISNTNTLTIEGGEGIDTVVGATDKVTISGEDASTSNKGIAIFSSNNFAVSSGTVTIKDEGVALAELAHIATDSFLGRTTSGTGDVEVLSQSDALAILGVEAGATANAGTVTSVGGTGTVNGLTLTGTVTSSGNLTLGGTLAINNGDWSGTALADGNIASASTWNAKQDTLTFGIANDNAVEIDDADAASGDYARFTANGLEGRDASDVLSDIGAQAAGNYITGTGSLSAQDLTDIGNLSGTNTGDQTKASFDLDHLYTLVGAASDDAEHLATFTGSTIADSQTIKQALQALETAVELRLTNNADDIMLGSLNLKKISDDATARSLIFEKNRATATTANDNDVIGQIEWKAYNDAGTPELGTFAAIKATVIDASNSDETGMIEFQVLGQDEFTDDNTPITALKLTGIDGNYEHADVEMGTGSTSTIRSRCGTHEIKYSALSGASYDKERILLKPGDPMGAQAAEIIMESADPVDFFKIEVGALGATTISTTEDGVDANADLTIAADGNLLANAFGNAEIDSSHGNITLDSNLDIILDADGDQITMKWGGATGQIDFTNENSGDGVIQQKVDAKDLVIKQYDGNEVIRFKDNGDVTLSGSVGDTLIIDKNSSTSTAHSNYGEKIDLDFSGNPSAGQTVTNYGLDIDFDFTGTNGTGGNTNSFGINIAMNAEAGSHSAASGIDNTGIKAVLTGDTETGDTTQIGYDLTITGGDTGSQTGLLLNTDDGSTDIKIVSSANTADCFTIKTFEDGATTFTTVEDGGGSTAHMTFNVDGEFNVYAEDNVMLTCATGSAIVFENADDNLGNISASGLGITNISQVGSDTDKFLMSDSGVIKYVTGANLRSYIGAGTSDVTLSGSTDNTIATVTGANALAGEANLTFDGTDLSIAGAGKLILGAGDTSISESTSDVLNITVGGQSMLAMTEIGSAGSIEFTNCSTGIMISSGTPLYFDGGALSGYTHISESSADNLRFTVGGDTVLDLTEEDTGTTINMGTSAAGFTRSTYADATNVTVDFRTGNKAHLDMTGGSIGGTLTLQFPAVSGNFVLVVQQDGSTRTIANYATKDSAGNAGNNDGGTAGAVRWAGGSAPDLTDGNNKRDILSFYWDATEEVCYGVASLDF